MASERQNDPVYDRCPDCGTRGYQVLPSYSNCGRCVQLRADFLQLAYGRPVNWVRDTPTVIGPLPASREEG